LGAGHFFGLNLAYCDTSHAQGSSVHRNFGYQALIIECVAVLYRSQMPAESESAGAIKR
jgi:hypothetical protein